MPLKKSNPDIVIITGLSGAGKSVAIKSIEDFGGFCVDNMPPALIGKFIKLIGSSEYSHKLIALGIDLRAGEFTTPLLKSLEKTKKLGYKNSILFLECSEKTIIKRYSESRRRHPLTSGKGDLEEAIRKESRLLQPLREKSDIIIDTTSLSPWDLKNQIKKMVFKKGSGTMSVHITAFGFKYGLPPSADMVIDTRFLPNPHYHENLSPLEGYRQEIKDFIFKEKISREFVEKYKSLLQFLVPNYIKEGKTYLNIAVGCTGGKHRSVAVSQELEKFLSEKKYSVFSTFRDLKR